MVGSRKHSGSNGGVLHVEVLQAADLLERPCRAPLALLLLLPGSGTDVEAPWRGSMHAPCQTAVAQAEILLTHSNTKRPPSRSGTDVEPPGRGAMHGSFQMAVVDPQRPQQVLRKFDAEIAPFPFVPPAGGTPGAA